MRESAQAFPGVRYSLEFHLLPKLNPDNFPLIVIVGPTGSGKSDLSLHLARMFGGEIVNYDSVQVYKGLDVGTAKVPQENRLGIPHHLLDILDLNEELNAGDYARKARSVLSELKERRRIPVLVGGTGLYLRALLDGLSPAPRRNEATRRRLRSLAARHPSALHRFLRFKDPQAAARIHPNDFQKITRAIEMMLDTGGSASAIQAVARDRLQGFAPLKIGLAPPRDVLREKLDARTIHMFSTGLLPEVEALLAAGFSPEAKPLHSIGYKQAVRYLQGHTAIADAILDCQSRTRQYAKRQMTWYRADPDIHWIDGFGNEPLVQSQASHWTRAHLLSYSGTHLFESEQ